MSLRLIQSFPHPRRTDGPLLEGSRSVDPDSSPPRAFRWLPSPFHPRELSQLPDRLSPGAVAAHWPSCRLPVVKTDRAYLLPRQASPPAAQPSLASQQQEPLFSCARSFSPARDFVPGSASNFAPMFPAEGNMTSPVFQSPSRLSSLVSSSSPTVLPVQPSGS